MSSNQVAQSQAALVLDTLSRHIGKRNGATAEQLVRELRMRGADGINVRRLRHIIEHLRGQGQHICAHPRDGYFMAATAEELLETCQFLHTRAMTSLVQIARMRGVSVPDLRGQLRLPT